MRKIIRDNNGSHARLINIMKRRGFNSCTGARLYLYEFKEYVYYTTARKCTISKPLILFNDDMKRVNECIKEDQIRGDSR